MKPTAFISTIIALAPAVALGHPGHSAFDFVARPPHVGHEIEFGTLLIATALTIVLFAGGRWMNSRRR